MDEQLQMALYFVFLVYFLLQSTFLWFCCYRRATYAYKSIKSPAAEFAALAGDNVCPCIFRYCGVCFNQTHTELLLLLFFHLWKSFNPFFADRFNVFYHHKRISPTKCRKKVETYKINPHTRRLSIWTGGERRRTVMMGKSCVEQSLFSCYTHKLRGEIEQKKQENKQEQLCDNTLHTSSYT